MISALFARGIILVFGTLFPAYYSYKAVKTKNVKEYVKWMMYWIVFAFFTCVETVTDLFVAFWFPFYYELKILLVLWLLSPATRGSSVLYRKFVHPWLTQREDDIDAYIARAKQQGYSTVLQLGSKGVNYAKNIIMETAIKGGGGLMSQLKRSYSVGELAGPDDLPDGDYNRNNVKALPPPGAPGQDKPDFPAHHSNHSAGTHQESHANNCNAGAIQHGNYGGNNTGSMDEHNHVNNNALNNSSSSFAYKTYTKVKGKVRTNSSNCSEEQDLSDITDDQYYANGSTVSDSSHNMSSCSSGDEFVPGTPNRPEPSELTSVAAGRTTRSVTASQRLF